MPKIALIIANSVASQHTQQPIRKPYVKQTAEGVSSALRRLPPGFEFETDLLVDQPPHQVLRAIDRASSKCTQAKDLLLVYYFGHGRLNGDELEFVHSGTKANQRAFLGFQRLHDRVKSNGPANILYVLDCCYAGAAAEQIDPALTRNCQLLACTTAATRARYEGDPENPVGTFTKAFLDGLFSPGAAVSVTDDRITAETLFAYTKVETERWTGKKQSPYTSGDGKLEISKYVEKPSLVPGVSGSAPPKCAYRKIFVIVQSMKARRFERVKDLYDVITMHYREAFLTPVKRKDGNIGQQLASWTVLRRYVAFLRALRVVAEDELRLSTEGLSLTKNHGTTYNLKLLSLIDKYLTRNRLSRDELRASMREILQRRGLPTRQNVILDLSLLKGYAFNQRDLGIVLDLCGYVGVFGMPRRRDQVYFPWSERTRRHRTGA